jgi:hypothetical protein
MSRGDKEYFRQRAIQEREAAEKAATDASAAIHRQLAKRYLDLADEPHLVEATLTGARSQTSI